jgi:hypothetical protein
MAELLQHIQGNLPQEEKERIFEEVRQRVDEALGGEGKKKVDVDEIKGAEVTYRSHFEVLAKAFQEVAAGGGNMDDLLKTILSTTPGLPFFYFVLPEVTRVHPQDTPVLNRLPRIPGQAPDARWKVVEKVGFGRQDELSNTFEAGEAPSTLTEIDTTYRELTAPYKFLHVLKSVSFQAVAAAANFTNLISLEIANAMIALHLRQEWLVLNGDTTVSSNQFDGLIKWASNYGVVKVINQNGASSVKYLTLNDIYDLIMALYTNFGALPRVMIAHPRLQFELTRMWVSLYRTAVGVEAGIDYSGTILRGFPLFWRDVTTELVLTRFAPVYNITIGGQSVTVTDIIIMDDQVELPAAVAGNEPRNAGAFMIDLIPPQVVFLAPLTAAHRILAMTSTVLAPRAPQFIGVLKGVVLGPQTA